MQNTNLEQLQQELKLRNYSLRTFKSYNIKPAL